MVKALWRNADFTSEKQDKKQEDDANWTRGRTVESCSYFVSHAWDDEELPGHPGKKVAMLRSFLCVQARTLPPSQPQTAPAKASLPPIPHAQSLVARLLVAFGLIAVFLIPLGWAVAAITAEAAATAGAAAGRDSLFRGLAFQWWWPPAAVLAVLFSLLVWVALSVASIVGSRRAPWAFASTTLWLDKCCVLQDTDETKAAGCGSFRRFLGLCDGMIAFVSPLYFRRLWCVYELATFCKMHRYTLDEKLVLLSLDWPSVLHPLKPAALTKGERDWFKGFSCAMVQCAKPSDRAYVLGQIRQEWESEEKFEDFVRDELPKILEHSKRRYSRQLLRTMFDAFDLAFGG